MDSSKFPLNNFMHILFTGYYNGLGVEVKSIDEIGFLYHLGCFGKGSASRSRPDAIHNDGSPSIMRKRQFLKRNYWYKKFENSDNKANGDLFFNRIDELVSKLISSKKKSVGDVIDLVSTDNEDDENNESCNLNSQMNYSIVDKQNICVIVPNSDSEEDNYFSSLKPKSCLNRVKLEEKLMLSLQESFFLLYALGCLQVVNFNNILNIQECWDLFREREKNFLEKYVVYHYFRSKGYVVKAGIKFGGDYLLYKEGPGMNHADYIVIIKYEKESFEWKLLLGHVRMANTTVKEVLIAEVHKSTKEDITLPNDLCEYSVREVILSRNIPTVINNDDE